MKVHKGHPERSHEFAVAYAKWGAALASDGKRRQAAEKYSVAVDLDPTNSDLYGEWGAELAQLDSQDVIISDFGRRAKSHPERGREFAFAYLSWGDALKGSGKFSDAIEKYDSAAEKAPEMSTDVASRESRAYIDWGFTYYDKGEYESAIAKLKSASTVDPSFAETYQDWGRALHKLHYYDEAIEKFAAAIDINQRYSLAYEGCGQALNAIGRYEEAIGKFARAVEIDDRYACAFAGKGQAYARLGKSQDAARQYAIAAMLDPDSFGDLNEEIKRLSARLPEEAVLTSR